MSIKISQPHDKWDERVTEVKENSRLTKTGELLVVNKVDENMVYIAVEKGNYRLMLTVKAEEDLNIMDSKIRNINKYQGDKTVVVICNSTKYPGKLLTTIKKFFKVRVKGQIVFNQFLIAPGQRLELR